MYITISCFARIKFSGPVIVLRTWTNFYTIFCKLILNVFREICYVSDRYYLLKMLALLYYIIVDFIKEIANQPYQINTCGITSN